MRNWNQKMYVLRSRRTFGFQRTYEELKLKYRTKDGFEVIVFSVPMRNWNLAFCFMLSHISRFQRTYEELKPPKVAAWMMQFSSFSAYLWGIETREAGKVGRLPNGFQRTYEELKLRHFKITPLNFYVFSVPMRNWNTSISPPFSMISSGFQRTYEELKLNPASKRALEPLSFQRTYEELKPCREYDSLGVQKGFSAYLWGIETQFPQIIRNSKLQRFQRTYEELKQRRVWVSRHGIIRFSAYLWGIETNNPAIRFTSS